MKNVDLGNIHHNLVLQKIVDTKIGKVYKHEVLSRFYNKNTFQSYNPEVVLDQLCATNTLDIFTLKQIDELSQAPLLELGIEHISLNIEPSQLSNKVLLDALVNLKNISSVDLSVEITERAQSILSSQQLQGARLLDSHGLHICLDDFGIGGSGLLRLIDLPVSEIKLDKLITRKLVHCKKTFYLLESIAKFCEQLGIALVAEGIEDNNVAQMFNQMNIFYHQGYYYHKAQALYSERKLVLS